MALRDDLLAVRALLVDPAWRAELQTRSAARTVILPAGIRRLDLAAAIADVVAGSEPRRLALLVAFNADGGRDGGACLAELVLSLDRAASKAA